MGHLARSIHGYRRSGKHCSQGPRRRLGSPSDRCNRQSGRPSGTASLVRPASFIRKKGADNPVTGPGIQTAGASGATGRRAYRASHHSDRAFGRLHRTGRRAGAAGRLPLGVLRQQQRGGPGVCPFRTPPPGFPGLGFSQGWSNRSGYRRGPSTPGDCRRLRSHASDFRGCGARAVQPGVDRRARAAAWGRHRAGRPGPRPVRVRRPS